MDVVPYQLVRIGFLFLAIISLTVTVFLFFRMRNKSDISSPGMPGLKTQEFVVYSVKNGRVVDVFARI